MKKNITINLCGRLFNIDEDAYELLNSYVDTLRSYFSRETDAEDIVNDIEMRISELLSELNSQGITAITIDHVKGIIARIGSPEQFAGDTTDGGQPRYSSFTEEFSDKVSGAVDGAANYFRGRKLYRNPKDKMIAGVISGLAAYFRFDVTLLRLIVALLCFLSFGTVLLVYVIMALIVPAAETPEQQLRMHGKPVNMSNLADEVVQDTDTAPEASNGSNNGLHMLLECAVKVFVVCFKLLLGIVACSLFFAGIGILIYVLCIFFLPESTPVFFAWDTDILLHQLYNPFAFFVISLLVTLFAPVIAIAHYFTVPEGVFTRVVLVLISIAALAATIVQGSIINNYLY